MPMISKQMLKYLLQNGFEITGQNGSHVRLKNPSTQRQTIVPFHGKALKKGLEQQILKQAGLK